MKHFIVLACLLASFLEASAQAPDQVAELLTQLKSKKADARTAALTTLADLGPKAAPAIPDLAGFLPGFDEQERVLATLALGKIGKASLPAVEKLLDHDDETTRFYAVWTLSIIGQDARALAPRLLKMFTQDEDDDVRVKSAYALARIAPDSHDVLAAFANLAAKKSIYSPERLAVIDELRHFGKAALKPLAQAMQDDGVAMQVAESIGHLLKTNKDDAFAEAVLPLVPEILKAAMSPDSEVIRGDGLTFVLSKHGAKLLPALEKNLADKDPKTQNRALGTLTRIASILVSHVENPALVKKMVKLVQPQFASPHGAMRLTLAMHAPLTEDTHAGFEELLLDGDRSVSQHAFGKFQLQGIDPTPALRKRMKAAKQDEKIRVACALHTLTRDLQMQKLLWDNLSHKDEAIRLRIACQLAIDQAVEDTTKARKLLLPALLEGLKSEVAERRVRAAEALSAVPAFLRDHTQELLDRLDDPSPQVRLTLLSVLPAFARADTKRTLQLMASLRNHEDANVRQAVILVLGSLGKDGVPLLAQIAQKDQDAVVSELACDQLSAMGRHAEAAAPALLKLAENQERCPPATRALVKIAPDQSFPALLDLAKNHDANLRKTIAYPAAVYENSSKLTEALLRDWKKSDLVQSRAIAQALLAIQPLLPEKKHNALVFAASPLISQQLAKVQKALKAKNPAERLNAVAQLGQLRLLNALQPTNIDPVGMEWTEFQPRNYKQVTQIEALLVQARADSDLQIRRQARKAQTAEVFPGLPWGYPSPLRGYGFGPRGLVLP
jgi:hypothetical protein